MKQRVFAFYAFSPEPLSSDVSIVAQCESESDAIVASLEACKRVRWTDGRLRTQKVFAELIGKSPAYVSQIKAGVRKLPEWMVEPFCRFTGTNLLRQYLKLHDALQRGEDTANARRRHIAEALRIAA